MVTNADSNADADNVYRPKRSSLDDLNHGLLVRPNLESITKTYCGQGHDCLPDHEHQEPEALRWDQSPRERQQNQRLTCQPIAGASGISNFSLFRRGSGHLFIPTYR